MFFIYFLNNFVGIEKVLENYVSNLLFLSFSLLYIVVDVYNFFTLFINQRNFINIPFLFPCISCMRPGHTSEVRAFDTLLRLFSKSDSWSGENREDQASNLF